MPLKHEGEKHTNHCCIPVFTFYAECLHSSLYTHYQFINQREFNKPDLLFVRWPNIILDWGAFFNYVDKVLATYQPLQVEN